MHGERRDHLSVEHSNGKVMKHGGDKGALITDRMEKLCSLHSGLSGEYHIRNRPVFYSTCTDYYCLCCLKLWRIAYNIRVHWGSGLRAKIEEEWYKMDLSYLKGCRLFCHCS